MIEAGKNTVKVSGFLQSFNVSSQEKYKKFEALKNDTFKFRVNS